MGFTTVPTSTPPSQWVAWPLERDVVGPDAVVYVRSTVPDAPPPSWVVQPALEEVAYDRGPLTADGSWAALVPQAPIPPGDHTISGDDFVRWFVVNTDPTPVAAPPSPMLRSRRASCAGGATELVYMVCGGGVVHLGAVSEARPVDLTLGDLTVGQPLGVTFDDLHVDTLGIADGWAGTVWFGDFDGAGRFTGWWPGDPVEVPTDGWAWERPIGWRDDLVASDPEACVPFTGWASVDAGACDDTASVPPPPASEGGGCDHAAPRGWLAALVGGVTALRVRGSGRRANPRR
ncbi:MAG: hypothetical protein ABMB14_08915 [Myxococcota bacterium]